MAQNALSSMLTLYILSNDGSYYCPLDSTAPTDASQWQGAIAARLGLEGKVRGVDFNQLLNEFEYQGEVLRTRRVTGDSARCGIDCTFSAPKTVSVAALVQGDSRVIEAHDKANTKAMQALEEYFALMREQKTQTVVFTKTSALAIASFRHIETREADPHLHTHNVVINATKSPNSKRYVTLVNDEIYNGQKFLGMVYQNELAYHLRCCGYQVTQSANGTFELQGYPASIKVIFGKRLQQIEEKIRSFAQQVENFQLAHHGKAWLWTRREKEVRSFPQLEHQWCETALKEKLILPGVPTPRNQVELDSGLFERRLIEGVTFLQSQAGLFYRYQLERYCLEGHLGEFSFDHIQAAIKNGLPQLCHSEFDHRQNELLSTSVSRELGYELEWVINELKGGAEPIVSVKDLDKTGDTWKCLTEKQAFALQESLTTCDRLVFLKGFSSAGREKILSAYQAYVEAKGYIVNRLDGCTSERINSKRNHLWLVPLHRDSSLTALIELLKQVSAQRTRAVLVDESGNTSGSHVYSVTDSLKNVLSLNDLTGEDRSHTVIFRELKTLAQSGKLDLAFDMLRVLDAYHPSKGDLALGRHILREYLNLPCNEREQLQILAGEPGDRVWLALLIRQALQQAGELGPNHDFELSKSRCAVSDSMHRVAQPTSTRSHSNPIALGEWMYWVNKGRQRYKNSLFRIKSFQRDGSVEIDSLGSTQLIQPEELQHAKYAYVRDIGDSIESVKTVWLVKRTSVTPTELSISLSKATSYFQLFIREPELNLEHPVSSEKRLVHLSDTKKLEQYENPAKSEDDFDLDR